MTCYIADPGSCHLGSKDRALKLIDAAADAGCDAIKFQLFTATEAVGGNVALDPAWIPSLFYRALEAGLRPYASIWDRNGMQTLLDNGCRWVKFARSQSNNVLIPEAVLKFERVYVTCGYWDTIPDSVIKLWTAQDCNGNTLYPSWLMWNYDAIKRYYQGVSLHSMDPTEIARATWAGLEYVEFHLRLGDDMDSQCPDGRFALTPTQVKIVLESIK